MTDVGKVLWLRVGSLAAIFLLVVCVDGATAGLISVVGDPGDGIVDVNGLPQDFSNAQLRVGVGGNNVRGLAAIYFFALPNVPARDAILGVELSIEYLGFARGSPGVFADPEFNIDLFGLGSRSTPTILSADYHDGDASLSTDTLIAEGFITPSTASGSLQSSGSNLLDFVTSLYQPDGTPTAAYVVFRINPDVDLPPFSGRLRGYELASADNANESFRPRLNLTAAAVPEPSTLVLWSLGAVALVGLGWRRRKRAA